MSKPRNEVEEYGWRWAPVPADVIMSASLKAVDVRLYAYLLWRARTKGSAFPGVDRMASDLHVSEPTIKRAIKTLLRTNWIKRFRRVAGSSITYIFESQADCLAFALSDHWRSNSQITGDLTAGSQMIRVKDTKYKDTKKKHPRAARASQSDTVPDLNHVSGYLFDDDGNPRPGVRYGK